MKILITGVAGFIGFSLASKLLEINKYNIYGIDNFDDYYSVKLKRERIKILNKKKKFIFKKIDITSDQISSYLKNILHISQLDASGKMTIVWAWQSK